MNDPFEAMPRLAKWRNNVATIRNACLDGGRRLSIDGVIAVLSPWRCDYEELFPLVEPHLADNVLADLQLLRSMRRSQQVQDVEAVLNRLRLMTGPSGDGQEERGYEWLSIRSCGFGYSRSVTHGDGTTTTSRYWQETWMAPDGFVDGDGI